MFLSLWRRAVRQLTPSSPQRPRKQARRRLQVEPLEDRVLPATFLVGNTDDAGAGSLRQAILDANANPGADLIAFDIGGGGVQTIRPASPLPALTGGTVVDGSTQPGYAGVPLIELNGSDAGPGADGLTVQGGDSIVKGLIVNGFDQAGIVLTIGWTNTVVGNYIGTDATGTIAVGNGEGIRISFSSNNIIGGTDAAERNLISGNLGNGLRIVNQLSGGNAIRGNYIGTDVSGTSPLGNRTGVELREARNTIGGTADGAGNLISGNDVGVAVYERGTIIQGNFIGTDVTGTAAVDNRIGVLLESSSAFQCLIGGTTPAARNLLSGNSLAGVQLNSAGGQNSVQGNYIGTDVTGTTPVRNGYGVFISFGTANNDIGGTAPAAGNLISGNFTGVAVLSAGGNRVRGNFIGTDASGTAPLGNLNGIEVLSGENNLIGGTAAGAANVISGNLNAGVLLTAGSNQVQGNLIGVNSLGTAALPNAIGVYVSGPSNLIGGTASGAGNVISGNSSTGVDIFGLLATGNRVEGNRIGTDPEGTAALPNGLGVRVGGSNNTIGGTAVGSRNVISGNSGGGVFLPGTGNLVLGNYIGTDATGSAALGNQSGVGVSGVNNVVGGTTAAARNVISGNNTFGVTVTGGNAVIQGNYVGTDATGTGPLGNRSHGILLSFNAFSALVGGATPGAGNVISGNNRDGVNSSAPNGRFQGNLIGTDATGTAALGNGGAGIDLTSGFGNTIGGTTPDARNVISANGRNGIEIFIVNNTVQGNYIGTDISGQAALGNVGAGVLVTASGAVLNVIGGTVPGAGNLISGNTEAGIFLRFAQNNRVEGNYIGTDATGTAALGNQTGVLITGTNNTVGGTAEGAGNLISGNHGDGVELTGAGGNRVLGNRIGTDVTGTSALGNATGIQTGSGSNANILGGAGAGNLISGNRSWGISLSSVGTVVQANFIGTDATGTQALGNGSGGLGGVFVGASNTTVGGTTPGAGNLISGNGFYGILVNTSVGNVIQGNYVGTDVTGTQALGNGGIGIFLGGVPNNTIGGTEPGAGNLISANGSDGIGITGNSNLVQGNWIGTDITGTLALGNGRAGVFLNSAAANTIGGLEPGAGNLISGNAGDGITFTGGSNNQVQGNLIGTDSTGTAVLGNGGNGVAVSTSPGNTIGGTEPGARNIISGNALTGVRIFYNVFFVSSSNRVEGNYIGTDITGTIALGNQDGVFVGGEARNHTVGGTADGAGNLISGNRGHGVVLDAGATANLIQGNRIGTDATGAQALGNDLGGIQISSNSNNNIIGGTEPGAGNLISANGGDGITIQGPNTAGIIVLGNRIGTDASGEQALGNGGNGVTVTGGAHDNVIGGTEPGAGNVIAFNGGDGVRIDAAVRNAVLHNSIFANAGLGIGLLNGGNDDQAAPVLTSATSGGGLTAIQGTFAGTPDTTFRFEIFVNTTCDPSGSGEGERFLLSLTVATDADGTASFAIELALEVPAGQFLTATATSPTGNTSAFSGCVEVTAPYHRRRPATARRGARRRPPSPPAVAEQAQGTQAQQRDGGGLRHDGSRVQELPAAVIVVR